MSGFAGAGASAFLASQYKDKILAPNPSTTRGAGIHINGHPREPRIIYGSGKYVVVRSLVDPSDNFVYRAHQHPVTVAKFSPNGYWVASGDTSGKVRVWSWDNPEHITKLECPVFAGEIKDLDWDSESKKIVACGDGSGMLVKCFTWDTGNSVGEMVGNLKRVLSVSFKQSRPFRIFSGGEEMKTIIYAGPPFKLQQSFSDVHSNFVNCVRYAPNGNRVVSCGSDKKLQFYDGATGAPDGHIENAHAGSIYSASFSADSSKLLTAGADKTVKLWDVATLACEQTFTFSADPQIGDMQVSVLWAGAFMVSVSLNGNINVLNPADPVRPSAIIQAHQVAITSMYYHSASDTIFTGSFDGVIAATPLGSGLSSRIIGSDKRIICGGVHSGKVTGLVVNTAGVLNTVGWDDSIRTSDLTSRSATGSTALNGQPLGMASATDADAVVVVTNAEIAVFRGGSKVGFLGGLGFTPTCVAVISGANEIAVGGDDSKTHIYSLSADGATITAVTTIATRSAVSSVAYNPAGDLLAIGDNGRQVEVYERGSWRAKIQGMWVNHTSRVTALAWSPNGNFLASASTDESIFFWNVNKSLSYHQIPLAHQAGITGIAWIDDGRVVTTGNDHCIVTWNIASALAAL